MPQMLLALLTCARQGTFNSGGSKTASFCSNMPQMGMVFSPNLRSSLKPVNIGATARISWTTHIVIYLIPGISRKMA